MLVRICSAVMLSFLLLSGAAQAQVQFQPPQTSFRSLFKVPDPRGEFVRLCAPHMVGRWAHPESVCSCLHDYAAAKFFGPHYIQHNPTAPDGIEGFKAFLGFLREKFPDSRSEIKRAFANGDYVILHVHSVREKGARGRAIVDIFRLENGKIVEHWDVAQEIPEKAANTNGMF